jgi:hypothetical protein
MEKTNPKALNLNTLDQVEHKVTLGFRCNANLKLRLAIAAQDYGLTLSEYVESFISGLDSLRDENEKLKKHIAFYENDFLKSAYEKHKNNTVDFTDSKGFAKSVKIQSLQDVYSVLIQIVKV